MIYRKMLELVKALRSGRVPQETGALRVCVRGFPRPKYGYCCLGVGCIVAHKRFDERGEIDGEVAYLPEKVMEYFGFNTNQGHRKDREQITVGDSCYQTLAEANDAGRTFAEIADAIKANWRML